MHEFANYEAHCMVRSSRGRFCPWQPDFTIYMDKYYAIVPPDNSNSLCFYFNDEL